MELDVEIARIAGMPGAVKSDAFSEKAIRGAVNTFERGDVFTLPKDFTGKVLALPITGSDNKPEFLMVEVTAVNGDKSVKRLYPSTFAKSLAVVDAETGKRVGSAKAEGQPCLDYTSKLNQAEGMDLLKGKTIKVAEVRNEYVHVFNGKPEETRQTSFLTFEYA